MTRIICLTDRYGSPLKIDFDIVTNKRPETYSVEAPDNVIEELRERIIAGDPWQHSEFMHPIQGRGSEIRFSRRGETLNVPGITLTGTFLETSEKKHVRVSGSAQFYGGHFISRSSDHNYDVPVTHFVIQTPEEIDSALEQGMDNLHDTIGVKRLEDARNEAKQILSDASGKFIAQLKVKGDAPWYEKLSAWAFDTYGHPGGL